MRQEGAESMKTTDKIILIGGVVLSAVVSLAVLWSVLWVVAGVL